MPMGMIGLIKIAGGSTRVALKAVSQGIAGPFFNTNNQDSWTGSRTMLITQECARQGSPISNSSFLGMRGRWSEAVKKSRGTSGMM